VNYKNNKFYINWSEFFLLFLLIGLVLPLTAKAAGASLYFSPNSGTFYVGSTFDVSIFLNTGGENVNAVQADLKFDPTKLQIASPTAGKSFISVWVSQPTYSNIEGTASFQGGIPSPGINTSAGLISTITFRAIDPGETTILFSDSSRVLLDDGKGTDILTSRGRGVYTLRIPPPEGPKVFSSTHPDQNKWYKNNNPTFSWEKEEGVTDFSFSLDFDPQGIPDNISEGDGTSISFTGLEDGIWYFHVKAKKADVWGGTSHYLVRIDSTSPASFQIEVSPSPETSLSQPVVSFITTDALSGFDHFEIKVIDITPGREDREISFFIEAASPYKLPALEVGKYMIVVRAFDKAGNWRDESVKIKIIPKGIGLTREGIYLFEIFLSWWLIILAVILILILVAFVLIRWLKKQKRVREGVKQKLRQRERKLKEDGKKIKVRVKEIK